MDLPPALQKEFFIATMWSSSLLSFWPARALNRAFLALLLVIFLQPLAASGCVSNALLNVRDAQTTFATDWQNVALGAGGYVTEIYLHPKEQNLAYIRTDNGGFFRWNEQMLKWEALTDHFPPSQLNYYGG